MRLAHIITLLIQMDHQLVILVVVSAQVIELYRVIPTFQVIAVMIQRLTEIHILTATSTTTVDMVLEMELADQQALAVAETLMG